MKRLIGFILFWVAIGMLLMLLLSNVILKVILMIIFILLGYYLFSC